MRFKDFMEQAPANSFGAGANFGARQPHMYYHKANTPTEPLVIHQQFPDKFRQSALDKVWRGPEYNNALAAWVNQVAGHIMNIVVMGEATKLNGKIIVAKEYIDTKNREIINKSGGRVTSDYAIASLLEHGAIKPVQVAVYKINRYGQDLIDNLINVHSRNVDDDLDGVEKAKANAFEKLRKAGVNITLEQAEGIAGFISYMMGHSVTNKYGKTISDAGPIPGTPNKFTLEVGDHRLYIPVDFVKEAAAPGLYKLMTSIGFLNEIKTLPCYEIHIMALKGMQLQQNAWQGWRNLSNDAISRIGNSKAANQFIPNN